ncbi:MAG: hypothetical protein U9N59_00820, partial [Campylobacterota bacterium]|nr:hypothetical protein [Campylobacterota bacterium]
MIDISNSMLYHIGNLNSESQRISYQMATGTNMENGSENSLLHADLINLDDKLRVTEGLKLQIDKTRALNDTADTNIGEVKLSLDAIKIDLMKSLNDGMDRSDKLALASNLTGIREGMLDRVNTKVDGEYVFSGSVTNIQTLTKDSDFDANGKVDFDGDGFLRKIAVQPGSYRDRGVTAYDISFYNGDSASSGDYLKFQETERIIDENGNEWKFNDNKNKLQKYDFNGVIVDPKEEIKIATGPSETIDIDLGVGSNSDAKGDYTIRITDASAVTKTYTYTATGTNNAQDMLDYFRPLINADFTGAIIETTITGDSFKLNFSGDTTVEISDTDSNYNIIASNETEATGLVQSVQSTYQLQVPTSPSGRFLEAKHNYFDELNKIINALEGYSTKLDGTKGPEILDDLVRDILGDGLDITTKQYDATNVGHGEIGGRNNVFEVAYDKILTQETHYNILIQEWGGA